MITNETPVVAFRRARKLHRSAWGHRIGAVSVAPRAPEYFVSTTEAKPAVRADA